MKLVDGEKIRRCDCYLDIEERYRQLEAAILVEYGREYLGLLKKWQETKKKADRSGLKRYRNKARGLMKRLNELEQFTSSDFYTLLVEASGIDIKPFIKTIKVKNGIKETAE